MMERADMHLLKAVTGTFLFALGMNLFLVPAGLYSGGLFGVSQIIRTVLCSLFPMAARQVDPAGRACEKEWNRGFYCLYRY